MVKEYPLVIDFERIRLEGWLHNDGAMIVGNSGTGKTFLFKKLARMQSLSEEDLQDCIGYRFPIKHVTFIDVNTPDPERLLFRYSNSLVIIDNADLVFEDKAKFINPPHAPDIKKVAFIVCGRDWMLPRFSFLKYELSYTPGEEVFRFVRSKL